MGSEWSFRKSAHIKLGTAKTLVLTKSSYSLGSGGVHSSGMLTYLSKIRGKKVTRKREQPSNKNECMNKTNLII